MNVQASQTTQTATVKMASTSLVNQASTVTEQRSNASSKTQKSLEENTKLNEAKLAKEEAVSQEDLQEQVDSMNKIFEANFTNLKFNIHEDLSRVYVQVIDRETEEIVREIPPERFLDMMASMLEFVGLLVDKKV